MSIIPMATFVSCGEIYAKTSGKTGGIKHFDDCFWNRQERPMNSQNLKISYSQFFSKVSRRIFHRLCALHGTAESTCKTAPWVTSRGVNSSTRLPRKACSKRVGTRSGTGISATAYDHNGRSFVGHAKSCSN